MSFHTLTLKEFMVLVVCLKRVQMDEGEVIFLVCYTENCDMFQNAREKQNMSRYIDQYLGGSINLKHSLSAVLVINKIMFVL